MRPPVPVCRRAVWAAALLSLLAPAAMAQDRLIDDVQVTANGDKAVISIEFACQMRFVADTAVQGGALLELRIAPFDSCLRDSRPNANTESYRPVGAEAAELLEVEYSDLGLGDSLLMLSFARSVSYTVTQRPTLRSIEIQVDLSAAGTDDDDGRSRQPISVHVVEPAVTADYMINLQSTREPADSSAIDGIVLEGEQRLYVSQIRLDGQIWHRLRLGFFATEEDARETLAALSAAFPRAWIGRAEPSEISIAAESAAGYGRSVPTLPAARTADDGEPDTAGPLPQPEQIPEWMARARDALLDGDNDEAAEVYAQLARTPGSHRPEALEFLGLAYERSGQPDRARGVYEQLLREFPETPGRERVAQRLESILASGQIAPENLREARAGQETWNWSMGLSQYYRRDDNRFDADLPAETSQSALLTNADLSLGRNGERIDLRARLSMNNYHDLLDEENGRGDQNRISYAYLDVAEKQQQWALRLGRQSLHTWGLLGRFDGAHFSHGLGGSRRLHLTAGYPVESTRDQLETDRQLAGIAVEFADLAGNWDISVFLNQQSIEGIDARKASGLEVRYFDERRSLTTMLDYDIDFKELNMALVLGTWRLPSRVTLSALLDQRKSPILSTRNALIGQPVDTVSELLLVWTEEEVRQLARDRTADTQTVTLGIATPIAERLQLNFDMTTSEIGATVSSGGVPAVPGTGSQVFYSTSLVATGLFASSDVNIWSVRVGAADAYETRLVSWDGRFPVGRRIRINPRIRLALWESLIDDRDRQTISPSLRLLMSTRSGYRLELEVGRDVITRTSNAADTEAVGNFVNLGYRAYF